MAAVTLDGPVDILVTLGLTLPSISDAELDAIRTAAPAGSTVRVAATMREAIETAGDAEVIFGFIPQAAVLRHAEAALGALHRLGHGHVPVPGHAGERRRADR